MIARRVRRLETFARAGYAARALVYVLLGYFAATTAGGETTTSVLDRLRDGPMGALLVLLVAVGLFGYGLFRLTSAILDLNGKGGDAKGLFGRAGPLLSGLAHLLLTVTALGIALGWSDGGSGRERDLASGAMALPGGGVLLILAGLLAFAAAFGNLLKAWTCKFMAEMDPAMPQLARWAGRAGYAARGIVFGLIGWQLVALGLGWGDAGVGMDNAIRELRSREWLFMAVAAGLALFGLFSLIMAFYARINDVDVLARLKEKARL